MVPVHKRITNCRICQSGHLEKFLSMGDLPLPNSFISPGKIGQMEKKYPLNVGVCLNCHLVQLLDVVDPEVMFRNYVYIPSASQTRMRNFADIAQQAREMCRVNKSSVVADIGSNDGSLLSYFKGYGIKTLGVDPATNLAKIAELKGIETINDYFSTSLASRVKQSYGPVTVITATNVMAHIDNLQEMFSAIKLLLSDSGIFICEFPYLADLLQKTLFDTIYHEHLSYFSLKPLLKIIKHHNLKIVDVRRTPIDGGALRLTISHVSAHYPEAVSPINDLQAYEKKLKLDDLDTYQQFAQQVFDLKENIIQTIIQLKNQKRAIVGYGASARGNILLSYCGLGHEEIDYIVDSTPYKQGLLTPGHHIPIYPEEALLEKQPDYALILAWNFAKEIVEKQSLFLHRGGKFIVPVPKIEIIKKWARPQQRVRVVIIMPAYNAAKTIRSSYQKIPKALVDEIILVDDASTDKTYQIAKKLPITVYRNAQNLGYGGNLKVCLSNALKRRADIVIEYHPDDQYDPKDLSLFIQKAKEGYDFALGSRFIFPKEAIAKKMPLIKFIANRAMSFIDELVLGIEMSEFHSGFRMYTRKLLERIPFRQNSDDYLFSFEIIVQTIYWGFRVAEVPVSCRYHPSMHTANLSRSTIYALGTFKTLWQYLVAKYFRFQRGPFLFIKPAPCPVCRQTLTRFEFVVKDATSGEQFSIFFCSLCKNGFTIPVPKNLSRYYPFTYYSRIKTWVYKQLQVRRPELIRSLLKKGKLLDIGCGDGNLSQQLDRRIYAYTGIETPYANSRNPLVKPVGVEGIRETRNSFHAVMFWESFEHLKDPVNALKKAHRLLKTNGFLIIECPDYSSWEKVLFASRWFHLDPPRHLFHYTPIGLSSLLKRMKFTTIEQRQIYAPEYTPVGLAQSLLFRISPRLNIFSRHQDKYVSYLIALFLGLFSLLMVPFSYIFYLFHGSPILLTVARKY